MTRTMSVLSTATHLDLIAEHEPELRSRIRIVATTDPAPIPFLVASAGCADDIVERLRAAFLAFAGAETADLRKRLCLEGFAPVDLTEYELIPRWEMKRKRPGTTTQAESLP